MFNRRLTGGLAWAGLILILAVPSVEILSGGNPGAGAAIVTDPVETASISNKTLDAVDNLLANGKPMPNYISDSVVAAAPRQIPATGVVMPVAPKVTPAAPAQTAALAPKPVAAPSPMPASMRPVLPAATEAEAPLVLDEQQVIAREAAVAPMDLEPRAFDPEPNFVSEEELEEWDSGSLADYLERRGLMSDASFDNRSSATFEDDDDFVFSEGTIERRRRNGDFNDDSFIVFPD